MGYYLKLGTKFVKRSKNRAIPTIDAILGNKEQARIYKSVTSAKKARTTYAYEYSSELNGKEFEIKAAKIKKAPSDKQ